MPVIWYTASIINWTVSECAELDRVTRKQMTLCKALHLQADVDRLYVPHGDGGRGLLSVVDVVCLEKHSLALYVSKCQEPIMAKIKEFSLIHDRSSTNTSRSTVVAIHRDQWYGKSIHGQCPNLMNQLQADSSSWLQRVHLKPVTESMIIAAQYQALNTHWFGYHILGTSSTDLYRRCHQYPETIEHIVAGCPSVAQTVYLERHDVVASVVHWCLCGMCGFERSGQWWCHHPEAVLDKTSYKLLYDFNIYSDRGIAAR